jgi:hypothetical protein
MFDEFHVDNNEYDFFSKLPRPDKLLYLYNMICREEDFYTEYYNESENTDDDYASDIINDSNVLASEDVLNSASYIIDESLNLEPNFPCLIYLNNFLIINSKTELELDLLLYSLMIDGCIIKKVEKTNLLDHYLQKLDYYEVVEITNVINPLIS